MYSLRQIISYSLLVLANLYLVSGGICSTLHKRVDNQDFKLRERFDAFKAMNPTAVEYKGKLYLNVNEQFDDKDGLRKDGLLIRVDTEAWNKFKDIYLRERYEAFKKLNPKAIEYKGKLYLNANDEFDDKAGLRKEGLLIRIDDEAWTNLINQNGQVG